MEDGHRNRYHFTSYQGCSYSSYQGSSYTTTPLIKDVLTLIKDVLTLIKDVLTHLFTLYDIKKYKKFKDIYSHLFLKVCPYQDFALISILNITNNLLL